MNRKRKIQIAYAAVMLLFFCFLGYICAVGGMLWNQAEAAEDIKGMLAGVFIYLLGLGMIGFFLNLFSIQTMRHRIERIEKRMKENEQDVKE